MGRKITSGDFPPSAQMRVEGAEIKGIMQSTREVKTEFGPKSVFLLKLVDCSCDFLKNKVAYEPAEGEIVEIMGTTTLTRQLNQVKPGEVVHIKYAGLGKKTKGNAPHLFDVEVE